MYGVDAVERMLEDLISVQENPFEPDEITAEKKSVPSQPEPAEGSDLYQKLVSETESDPLLEKPEPSKTNMRRNSSSTGWKDAWRHCSQDPDAKSSIA